MMKKTYSQPQIDVYEVKPQNILEGSSGTPGYGGPGNAGDVAGSKLLDFPMEVDIPTDADFDFEKDFEF